MKEYDHAKQSDMQDFGVCTCCGIQYEVTWVAGGTADEPKYCPFCGTWPAWDNPSKDPQPET